MKLKRIILITLIVLLLSISFTNIYATAIVVTKENLNESFQDISDRISWIKFTVSDNTITINIDEERDNIGEDYVLNYDLTSNPTFIYEMQIEKGMSYDDFEKTTGRIYLPMFAYIAVANIQGIDFSTGEDYFYDTFSDSFSTTGQYKIVDDINDNVNKDESDSNIIYTSEFGEKVIEYVTTEFKNKQTISDSSNDINSYLHTIELKDITDNSCKLVFTLTINMDADFSKISNPDFDDNDSSSDNNNSNDNNNSSNNDNSNDDNNSSDNDNSNDDNNSSDNDKSNNTTSTDTTTATSNIPQTGINNIAFYIAITFTLITSIVIKIKLKKYKRLK